MEKAKEIKETVNKEVSETTEKVKSFGKNLWRKVKIIIAILMVIGLIVGAFFVFSSYSDGYRAGNVMKISKKGVVFKTYEGQLNVGGLQNGGDGDMATTVWNFSVSEDHVVRKIEKAVDNGSKVKLYYREKYFQVDIFGDTKYFVYDVEEVGGKAEE